MLVVAPDRKMHLAVLMVALEKTLPPADKSERILLQADGQKKSSPAKVVSASLLPTSGLVASMSNQQVRGRLSDRFVGQRQTKSRRQVAAPRTSATRTPAIAP